MLAKGMIDLNCKLLPSDPRSEQNLTAFAVDYIQQMKEDFKDRPDKYAMFSRRLHEAASRSVSVFLDESGPMIRLKGVPPGEVDRIRACVEKSADELPGLVDVEEEEEEGVEDEGLVRKWCGFNSIVGGTLPRSRRSEYGLLRHFINYDLGLMNRCELVVAITDTIREYPYLVEKFGSLFTSLDREGEGEDGYQSNCSSDLTEGNGRKRKQREERKKTLGRHLTDEEEDDMYHALVLEIRLAEAILYASQILHGSSDTSKRTGQETFERVILEMYDDKGPEVLAMTKEDPMNTLPAVISRLRQKELEYNGQRYRICSRTRARDRGK